MVKGNVTYPHRRDLHHKNFWMCPDCSNFVGTNNRGEGRKPLGVIANKEMKKIRMQIHAMLDPIWQSNRAKRADLYKKISEKLGYEYHTAELKSFCEAKKVYEIVKGML